MTRPESTPETVLPDATREQMLEAAGMTTGHRWEEKYVSDVTPDSEDGEDAYFQIQKTRKA